MKEQSDELKEALKIALDAEISGEFFSAGFFYKNVLELSIKEENSYITKVAKNKIVEMNKLSISSGKDYKTLEVEHKLKKENIEQIELFIQSFLKLPTLNEALVMLSAHPYLNVSMNGLRKTNTKVPLTLQIFNHATISDSGHILRGSSDGNKAWFMSLYSMSLQMMSGLYLQRLFNELSLNGINGETLNKESLFSFFENNSIFPIETLKILNIAIERYYSKDHISCMHILVPQFESLFLHLSERLGIDVVVAETRESIATRTKILSERDLDSESFQKIWGEDFCQQIKFILFDSLGYKLRHKIAHGEIKEKECNFENSTLILHLYLKLTQVKLLSNV